VIQAWEARSYQPSVGSVSPPTNSTPDLPSVNKKEAPIIRRVATPQVPSTPIAPKSTVFSTPIIDNKAPKDGIACPNCGKVNPKRETYCYACGHMLEVQRSNNTKAFDEEIDPRTRWGTSHFGQFSSLTMTVRGTDKAIEVVPEGELVIGRGDAESVVRPDIDLAAFDAEELGVSRLHASIKRLENTVSLMDMNSRNGTYLNGQKLHPNEVRVLRDGDEIRLGRMTLRISFKQQIRRLQDR
jgi:hypothetical protein